MYASSMVKRRTRHIAATSSATGMSRPKARCQIRGSGAPPSQPRRPRAGAAA
jgi:hypothetical protein